MPELTYSSILGCRRICLGPSCCVNLQATRGRIACHSVPNYSTHPGKHFWLFAVCQVLPISIGRRDGNLANCTFHSAALIYTSGAVIVLCQTLASWVSQLPARQNPILAYIIAMACCILAGIIAIIYEPLSNQANDGERTSDPSTQLLIPLVHTGQDNSPATLWGLLGMYSRRWRNTHSGIRRVLKSLGIIFFLAAVAKATRPLFLTYIQHRVGVPAEVVSADFS